MDKWYHESYGSGTQVVTTRDSDKPYYYVYAGRSDNERAEFCEQLCDFLNTGKRPAWFNVLTRMSENEAVGMPQISIIAVGPMRLPPNDNGALNWQRDESPEAKGARRALIDKVCSWA